MEKNSIGFVDLAGWIWAGRRTILKWGIVSMVVGIIIAFSIPRSYQTSVQIAMEGTGVGNNGFGAVGGFLGGGFNLGTEGITTAMYPRIVKTGPFLTKLAKIEVKLGDEKMTFYDYITKRQEEPWWRYLFSLPFNLMKNEQEEPEDFDFFNLTNSQRKYFQTLRKYINVEIDKKVNIYTVSVEMQNNVIAAVIADSLVQNMGEYMTNYYTAKSRESYLIKKKIFEEAKQRYYEADAAYAAAVDKNRGISTHSAQLKIERLRNEKALTYNIYQQVAAQVETSRIKLQEDTPVITVIEPASISAKPIAPNKILIIILCIIMGVSLAATKVLLFKKGNNMRTVIAHIFTTQKN